MSKHTPVPWVKRVHELGIKGTDIYGVDDTFITSVGDYSSKNSFSEQRANAEFIVLACNNHEKLLEACKKALESLNTYEPCVAEKQQQEVRLLLRYLIKKVEAKHD